MRDQHADRVRDLYTKLKALEEQIFETLLEARVLCERWRRYYNTKRPHSSLGYRPPAPETVVPWPGSAMRSLPAMAGLT